MNPTGIMVTSCVISAAAGWVFIELVIWLFSFVTIPFTGLV